MAVSGKNGFVNYPSKSIKKTIDELKKLPGVGPRLAERIVDYIVEQGTDYIKTFANIFEELSDNIKQCTFCFGYAEDILCSVCNNQKRSRNMLCIVEHPRDVMKIESLNEYNGLYFVLGTVDIQNIDNCMRIKILRERLDKDCIKEVILAMGTDFDSAFIVTYMIEKILSRRGVAVSQLSIGVPFGYPIEFVDTNTLSWAFKSRKYIR